MIKPLSNYKVFNIDSGSRVCRIFLVVDILNANMINLLTEEEESYVPDILWLVIVWLRGCYSCS